MSRSSKKVAIYKDKANKYTKRAANKRIRAVLNKLEDSFKGTNFIHKLYNSWNISDWTFWPSNKQDTIKALRK